MILDTDVLIDIERNDPAAIAWVESLSEPPSIPGFAAMEMVQDAENLRDLRRLTTFLSSFQIVWPSEADMDRALVSFGSQRLRAGLGLVDCLIAATALGRGDELVTFNRRHYRHVPDLRIFQPYQSRRRPPGRSGN